MGDPTFWDNNEKAQKHISKLNGLNGTVQPIVAFRKKVEDIGVTLEFVEMSEGAEKEGFEREV